MSSTLFLDPSQPVITAGGLLASGAKRYFYLSGTSTLATVYADADLTTPHDNPVVADSAGRFPEIYLDTAVSVRVKTTTAAGVSIDDVDPYFGSAVASGGTFASRTLLAAIEGANGNVAYLSESGREGWFKFSSADNSANVTSDPQQAIYIAPSSDTDGSSGAWVRILDTPSWYNVKWFGAKGDGVWSSPTLSGTDDTTKIQAAIDYVYAAGGGAIYFPDGIYKIAGALADTSQSNAQIVLPKESDIRVGRTIKLCGNIPGVIAGDSKSGAILWSTLSSGTGNMIGCKVASTNVSRIGFVVENMIFRMKENPTNSAIDCSYLPMTILRNIRVDVPDVSTGSGGIAAAGLDVVEPTTATSCAIKGPLNNVAMWFVTENVHISGFYQGLRVGELWGGNNLAISATKWPLVFIVGLHSAAFGRVLITNCPNTVKYDDAPAGSGFGLEVNIQMLSIERDLTVANGGSGPSWVEPFGYDFDDSLNLLRGTINTFINETYTLVFNGAKNLRVKLVDHIYPLFPIFGSFLSNWNARGTDELRNGDGSPTGRSDIATVSNTNEYVGAHWVSNGAGAGADYRIAGWSVKTQGHVSSGRFRIGTANAGTFTDWFEVDKAGNFVTLSTSAHIHGATGNEDMMGKLAFSGESSKTKTFARSYGSSVSVVVTPNFALPADTGYNAVPAGDGSGFTINTVKVSDGTTAVNVTGSFSYHVMGNG